MKTMRLLLRDRVSAGTIAVLIAYSLVFQALLAGLAQGALAASSVDPLHVICSSSGAVSIPPDDQDTPSGNPYDCPCAMLCRLAGMAAPAVFGGQIGVLLYVTSHEPIEFHVPAVGIPRPALRGLIAEPRAPPVSI